MFVNTEKQKKDTWGGTPGILLKPLVLGIYQR